MVITKKYIRVQNGIMKTDESGEKVNHDRSEHLKEKRLYCIIKFINEHVMKDGYFRFRGIIFTVIKKL